MKRTGAVLLALCFLIQGCGKIAGMRGHGEVQDYDILLDSTEAPVFDEDSARALAAELAVFVDGRYVIAPSGSLYAARLAQLSKRHIRQDGLELDFQVYLSSAVDVFSLPDGSIRIHGGLMDLLNGDELLFVIGTQIGHIALGHSQQRLELASVGAIDPQASFTAPSSSQLKAISARFRKTRYSQAQLEAADAYAMAFLKKYRYSRKAAETALRKIAELNPRQTSLSSGASATKARRKRLTNEGSSKRAARVALPKKALPKEAAVENSTVLIQKEPEVQPPLPLAVQSVPRKPKKSRFKTATLSRNPVTAERQSVQISRAQDNELPSSSEALPAAKRNPRAAASVEKKKQGGIVPGWYIQIAADTSETEARTRVRLLESMNIRAQIQQAVIQDELFYRILVGPYSSRVLLKQKVLK